MVVWKLIETICFCNVSLKKISSFEYWFSMLSCIEENVTTAAGNVS